MFIVLTSQLLQTHMWNDGSWNWAGWFAMTVMMILFWGTIVGVIVWAVRGGRTAQGQGDSALNSASERFARGELNEDEFQKIKRVLSGR